MWLTQRRDVHQHEVASLGDDGGHSRVSQDGGQAVPLALQLLRQGGEVAFGPSHQLQVVEQTLSHGLLKGGGAWTVRPNTERLDKPRSALACRGVGQV